MTTPDVVVLPPGDHGHASKEYAALLQDRLPDHDVRHADSPAQERTYIETARVVTGTTIDEALLERADHLELFGCTWAGYGHLPLETLAEYGVTVTNASGVFAPNIAEYVIGKILEFVRRSREGYRREQEHEWRHYRAGELAGSMVTIVGLGSIGMAVAERLETFDVRRMGIRHTPSKGGPINEVVGYDVDDMHEAFAETDYLVLACPLTDKTRRLVGEAELDRLPPEAVLINIARGKVVDTAALVEALQDQRIGGAALDVTDPEPLPADHPLWAFENVHVTPHNAGSTPKLLERLSDLLVENVRLAEDTGSYTGLRNQIIP